MNSNVFKKGLEFICVELQTFFVAIQTGETVGYLN